MLKKSVWLVSLLIILLVGCSEVEADSSAKKDESPSLYELLSSDDKPLFYSDEKEVKEFRKEYGFKNEISVDRYDFSDDTLWSMSNRDKEHIQEFEFYFDRMNVEPSIEESFAFMYSFIPADMKDLYQEPNRIKAIDKDGEQRYYWQFLSKETSNESSTYPHQIVLEHRMTGDRVTFARFFHQLDRQLKNFEEVKWDVEND